MQLVLIYLPAFVLMLYVLISGCTCLLKGLGWKKQTSSHGKRSKLQSIVCHFSSSDIENTTANKEELPHRLTSPNEYSDRGATLREPLLFS